MSILFEAVEAWIQLLRAKDYASVFAKDYFFFSLNGSNWDDIPF